MSDHEQHRFVEREDRQVAREDRHAKAEADRKEREQIAAEDEATRMANSANAPAKPQSADDPVPERTNQGSSKPITPLVTTSAPPEVRPRPDLDGRMSHSPGYDLENERENQAKRLGAEQGAPIPNNAHGREIQRDLEEDARRKNPVPDPYVENGTGGDGTQGTTGAQDANAK